MIYPTPFLAILALYFSVRYIVIIICSTIYFMTTKRTIKHNNKISLAANPHFVSCYSNTPQVIKALYCFAVIVENLTNRSGHTSAHVPIAAIAFVWVTVPNVFFPILQAAETNALPIPCMQPEKHLHFPEQVGELMPAKSQQYNKSVKAFSHVHSFTRTHGCAGRQLAWRYVHFSAPGGFNPYFSISACSRDY